MSSIPPNSVASGIQAHSAAQRASEAKRAESAGEGERSAFTEKLTNVIENEDQDSEVYADAEGAGGHGPGHEASEEETDTAADDSEGLVSEDDSGGLDLTA